MKKITYFIISIFLLTFINACSGYKPIFGSSNFQFTIKDYSVQGDKRLGNLFYSKLNNIARKNEKNSEAKKIKIQIKMSKDKVSTVKNNAGKIIEYKVLLNTEIVINDFFTNEEIVNQSFNYYSPYKVQDQYSETLKLENKAIENMIDKTYQNLLIIISENI